MDQPNAAQLATTVAWWGFILAVVFGAVAKKTDFCTLGAVYDIIKLRKWGRMRSYLLAIAVAIIGANLLELAGYVNLSASIYQTPQLHWFSNFAGGLIFGVGMVYAVGCGNRTLVRIGGGSLRALVIIIVMAISAYMTLRGLFGVWRVRYFDPVSIDLTRYGMHGQDLASIFAAWLHVKTRNLQIIFTALVSGGLLLFVFGKREFWRDYDNLLSGVVVGLLVVGAWYLTGHIGYFNDGVDPQFVATNTHRPESFSFVAPAAYTLQLLMLWTDDSLIATFGIVSTVGVVVGAFLWALYSKTFRWEGFRSTREIHKSLLAGVLMGFGGVTAMGCTIGQGITGFSTLAVGSIIAFAGINMGAALVYKIPAWWLIYKMNHDN